MRQSFRQWLEQQVARLDQQIKSSSALDAVSHPSREEFAELRRLAVIHRFLERQLRDMENRREPAILRPRKRQEPTDTDLIRARAS